MLVLATCTWHNYVQSQPLQFAVFMHIVRCISTHPGLRSAEGAMHMPEDWMLGTHNEVLCHNLMINSIGFRVSDTQLSLWSCDCYTKVQE